MWFVSLPCLMAMEDVAISREYMDGLGRVIQKVIVKGSPEKKDIVIPVEYDQYGREVKEYLPYASATGHGTFKTNAINVPNYALSDQYLFYTNSSVNNADNLANDYYPYRENKFETSAGNMIQEQSAPGNSWRMGQGHTTSAFLSPNSAGDNVRNRNRIKKWAIAINSE
jgi:hypothetical protein